MRLKTLELQVRDAVAKYARFVEETAQVEEKCFVRIASSELSLEEEFDRFAQFEKRSCRQRHRG